MKQAFSPSKIGKNLLALRKANGWQQQYVADRLGVSRQLIYFFEHGQRGLSIKRLQQFCNLYQVKPEAILGLQKTA